MLTLSLRDVIVIRKDVYHASRRDMEYEVFLNHSPEGVHIGG